MALTWVSWFPWVQSAQALPSTKLELGFQRTWSACRVSAVLYGQKICLYKEWIYCSQLTSKSKRQLLIHLSQLQNGRLFNFSTSAKLCSKDINGFKPALMPSKVIKNYLTLILVHMVMSQRPTP